MGETLAGQWFQLFQVAQAIVMAVATVFVWLWGRNRQQQQEALDARFAALERRLDRAGAEGSKLGSIVQTLIGRLDRLPDDLRRTFLPLDRAEDFLDESRRDRQALWQELRTRDSRGGPR